MFFSFCCSVSCRVHNRRFKKFWKIYMWKIQFRWCTAGYFSCRVHNRRFSKKSKSFWNISKWKLTFRKFDTFTFCYIDVVEQTLSIDSNSSLAVQYTVQLESPLTVKTYDKMPGDIIILFGINFDSNTIYSIVDCEIVELTSNDGAEVLPITEMINLHSSHCWWRMEHNLWCPD